MNIVVMGAGGIGGYYGGRLAQAGGEVAFVARGAHLQALQRNGLQVTSVQGDFTLPQVSVVEDAACLAASDVVVLATKAWDIESAARQVAPILKPDGVVVHFQNGVDIADRLTPIVGRERLVGGVAYGVVQLAGPGHIDHSTKVHQLIYGAITGSPAGAATSKTHTTLAAFHKLCDRANFDNVLVDDIEVWLWNKFLFICAYSGVTSLLRLPIGPILADRRNTALFVGCMREIKAVADRKAIELPEDCVENRLKFAQSLEPTATSSMQRDLEQGNRLELQVLNGTVSRMGRELGIPTPINDQIYNALKPYVGGRS